MKVSRHASKARRRVIEAQRGHFVMV